MNPGFLRFFLKNNYLEFEFFYKILTQGTEIDYLSDDVKNIHFFLQKNTPKTKKTDRVQLIALINNWTRLKLLFFKINSISVPDRVQGRIIYQTKAEINAVPMVVLDFSKIDFKSPFLGSETQKSIFYQKFSKPFFDAVLRVLRMFKPHHVIHFWKALGM